MRLFVALDIPTIVRDPLADFVHQLRPLAPQFKWVRTENLHLTLKFIGHVEPTKLDPIVSALQTVHTAPTLLLQFQGLGFFPNEKRPRVFWCGIEAPRQLVELASAVDGALANLGFPREERDFSPHLTLARIEGGRLPDRFRETIPKQATRQFGEMTATKFCLKESKLKSTRAEYTTVQTFPFAPES